MIIFEDVVCPIGLCFPLSVSTCTMNKEILSCLFSAHFVFSHSQIMKISSGKTDWLPEKKQTLFDNTLSFITALTRRLRICFFSLVIDDVSVLQEHQASERTISDLNVVMDASDLQNFSNFLSG